MAIDPNIKKKADDIRNKIYGKEVRESLASGLEAISSDVIENEGRQSVVEGRQSVVEGRQDSVESQWQVMSDEMTDKDVISAPEIIAARDGEANLKARLDKEKNEVTAQLAQTAIKIEDIGLRNAINPDQFEGTDHAKITAALIKAKSTNKMTIIFDRFYDVTGLGSIMVGASLERYNLVGLGGGIIKNDAGNLFDGESWIYTSLTSQNMTYKSTVGAGTVIWNGSKLIGIHSINDNYLEVDHVLDCPSNAVQSFRFIGCDIQKGAGYAFQFNQCYDLTISHNRIENRVGAIRQYAVDNALGTRSEQNNLLRINDNCIEAITGVGLPAIHLGKCISTEIRGNYFEHNASTDIDLSGDTNTNYHQSLIVANNIFYRGDDKLRPLIKWGNVKKGVSISNSGSGIMHDIEPSVEGSVISMGDIYGTLSTVAGQHHIYDMFTTLEQLESKALESWKYAIPQNGWSDMEGLRYAKNSLGFVVLLFSLYSGTVTQGTTITTLPAEYAPKQTTYINLLNESTGTYTGTSLQILPSGEIRVPNSSFGTIATDSVYSGQIEFYAG